MKKSLILLSTLLSTGAMASASVTVTPMQQQAMVGVQTVVLSTHHAHIVNETGTAQTYQVFYHMCVQNHDCRDERETPTLQPGQAFDNTRTLKLGVTFNRQANFSTELLTEVRGESNASQRGSGSVVVR